MQQRMHATCIAFGEHGVLLRGPSGSGKSDLALRLLGMAWPPAGLGIRLGRPELVADDQVLLNRDERGLLATAPSGLAGLLEVRGVGVLSIPSRGSTYVRLLADLTPPDAVPRMPEDDEQAEILNEKVLLTRISALEASAPLKLILALARAVA